MRLPHEGPAAISTKKTYYKSEPIRLVKHYRSTAAVKRQRSIVLLIRGGNVREFLSFSFYQDCKNINRNAKRPGTLFHCLHASTGLTTAAIGTLPSLEVTNMP